MILFILSILMNTAQAGPCSLRDIVRALAEHKVEGTYKTFIMASVSYKVENKVMGTLDYSWDTKNHILRVGNLSVEESIKNRGVSKALYERMVSTHPDAAAIESVLMWDNFEAATEGKRFSEMTKEECMRRVVKTPAYKVRASLGFSTITSCTFSSVFQAITLITSK
jgi:hypothetical protein